MRHLLLTSLKKVGAAASTLLAASLIIMLPATSVLAVAGDIPPADYSAEPEATQETPAAEDVTEPEVTPEDVTTPSEDSEPSETEVTPESDAPEPTPNNLSQSPAQSFSASSSPNSFNAQADDPVRNEDTGETYTTIQAAIDDIATLPGHTISFVAGTYNEAVTVNKSLTLRGAGSTSIVSQANTGSGVIVSANDVTLENFLIDKGGVGNASGCLASGAPSSGSGLTFAGALVSNLTLDNLTVTGASNGMRVGGGTTIDGLTIDDSHFDGNCVGWYLSKETAASNPSDVTNVTVTNTTFDNNQGKGIYAEKLSDALFDGITVNNSGIDPAYGFNAGVDINLKWMPYAGIEIVNSVVTGSGLMGSAGNALFPAGITIKARDDAPTYSAPAASLNNVALDNVTVTGGVVGVRFGEPGKSNTGPTGVVVTNSTLSGTGGYGLVNQSTATVDATTNWWGTTDPTQVASKIEDTGPVTYEPYCADSACETIFVDPTDLNDTALAGAEVAIPENADINSTPSLEFLDDFTVTAGNSSVVIPAGTVITRIDGEDFNATNITATPLGTSGISGLHSATVVDGVLQWGIEDLGLAFSPAITIKIFVGTALNGETLTIRRSVSGEVDWTGIGIVDPKTCVVAAGICEFGATKASYYAAVEPADTLGDGSISTGGGATSGPYAPVASPSGSLAYQDQTGSTTASSDEDEDKSETTPEASDNGEVQAAADEQADDFWWWVLGVAGGLATLYIIQRYWNSLQKQAHKPKK